ncbi:hypothetical protein GA0061101_10275 [Rhizobium lusitanum]|jgi:hypothetical protein|uniref:Uncharacterized protein n=1 Tax=Rhizobium lusitanum TaxID=293958 RepID=A0A1C3UBL5_9HYPH|nr:hypothetical protein [Rhizobium sp. SG741]SCB12881.1 hypothetical protein GA0061101_10275 [Rhizobium lusitanum]
MVDDHTHLCPTHDGVAFVFDWIYRAPKIAEPTRTLVAPKATAIS